MTEERFEEIIEQAGETMEKGIEKAADKFDKSMNRAWTHGPVRFIANTVVFMLGAFLIVRALPFYDNDQHTIANLCLISGIVVIVSNIVELMLFRRESN